MNTLLAGCTRLFDALEDRWHGVATQRALGTAIAALFLGALLVIELNRQGLLAEPIASRLPTNHFRAIVLVFTVLLIVEVVGLVFALAGSVANSLGKQFEVLSLILLRKAFLELALELFVHLGQGLHLAGALGRDLGEQDKGGHRSPPAHRQPVRGASPDDAPAHDVRPNSRANCSALRTSTVGRPWGQVRGAVHRSN